MRARQFIAGATPPESSGHDGVVRVSKQELIRLRHGALRIRLRNTRILSPNSGNYLSPFKGRGMEFEEARLYMPGDDIRSLDWRVTARTGKAHTKVFREERERSVLLWVDFRKTMFFATRGAFKSVLAARTAALLAWSAAHHGDRLGGLIFNEQQHQELRPQRGAKAVLHFVQQLADHPVWQQDLDEIAAFAANESDIMRAAMMRLRRVSHPGSLVFLISDFRHLESATEAHLLQLARHNDVVMIQIHDPMEHSLPPAGVYRFSDGTRTLAMNTADRRAQDSYQQQWLQHHERLKSLCRRYAIPLLSVSTAQDLMETLQNGLGLG